jgi:flagellar hook assembly protein FlgD
MGTLAMTVSAAAGPFLVTSPNTAVTLNANIPQTITWDVANTTASPVSCANVNIKLSTDGGTTFPITLKSNTPNDGSEIVNLPMVSTSTARIKVEAADNIFFDISNTNFTISTVSGISNIGNEPLTFKLSQNFPNPFNPSTMINFVIPQKSVVSLNVYDISGKLVERLINNEIKTEGSYSYELDGSRLSSGIYYYRITAGNFTETKKMIMIK